MLKEAIEEVDALTDGGSAYYGINCAHPTHYDDALAAGEPWLKRIRTLKSNASSLSLAELNEVETFDDEMPVKFGDQHRQLREALGNINITGGCCGTDHRHITDLMQILPVGRFPNNFGGLLPYFQYTDNLFQFLFKVFLSVRLAKVARDVIFLCDRD